MRRAGWAAFASLVCIASACGGGSAASSDGASELRDMASVSTGGADLTTMAPADAGISTPTNGPVAMPLINRGVPVYASTQDAFHDPAQACDESQSSAWFTSDMPAWIAWDLSSVATDRRQDALVVWNAPHAAGFFLDPVESYQQVPVAYTVEVNKAAGGGSPPTSGWEVVATVANNGLATRQHLVALAGAAWVRLAISAGTNEGIAIDVDVYSAPSGASDSWMFMGDSITFMTMTYAFSDLASRVNALDATRWPAVIDAAIGGTNTTTALEVIDETIAASPSRFIVLAYGTNDHPQDFVMEQLIQKVLAAGRVPVVPHMPWSSGGASDGAAINAMIDALYMKYPAVLPGPDLWQVTFERTDYIPMGDVHPTDAGQKAFRQAWAERMAAQP